MTTNLDLAKLLHAGGREFVGFWGVIATHTTGPNRVTVYVNGCPTPIGPCLYSSSYSGTPTAGDVVYGRMTMGARGPDYLVEGKTA